MIQLSHLSNLITFVTRNVNREEAASSVIGGKMYILGGIIDGKITNR